MQSLLTVVGYAYIVGLNAAVAPMGCSRLEVCRSYLRAVYLLDFAE